MIGYYILMMLIGFIAGMMLTAAISINRLNEAEALARASRKSLANAEDMIVKQAKQIEDLERNLEFVTNNLTPKKKEYIGR